MDSTRSLAPPFLPHSFPPRSTRYPGYQLIIRLFSIIDRRNRSIVHLPKLSALFESHPHLDSINVRVSLREINLSYIGLTYRRQRPITKLAKHGAVTQNGLRQGWPPLFALAIFISSTCAALPADRILRISYGWNFLLTLRERIEALARKQCQATGKLPLPHHHPTLRLATRKINVISRVFAVSSRCSLQRLRKLKLRDFGLLWEKRNILSSPPRTYTCKTEVRLLKGREEEGREGRTASDLPCLIFIGNERISSAFFLPFTISLG